MNPQSGVMLRDESEPIAPGETYGEAGSPSSPFAAATTVPTAGGGPSGREQEDAQEASSGWLSSPFSEGLVATGRSESEDAFAMLAAELEDEGFEEALQALVDEAAGRHLSAATAWASEDTDRSATGEVEAWMSGVATEADTLLEQLELHFASRTPESLLDGEVEAVLNDALVGRGHPGLDGEDFFGALARKARSLAKGAVRLAKRGISMAGRLLLGPLFKVLRRIVRPLLARVLAVATRALPARYRQDAVALAGKLGIPIQSAETGESQPVMPGPALAELFDAELAQAAIGGDEVPAGLLEAEFQSVPDQGEDDGAVGRLDAARAHLAERIAEAAPGSVITAETEQFLPVVMAALPLIRMGIRALGRDDVVGYVAKPIAELIKGHVGPEATQALSRAIADKGLALIGLEAEAGGPSSLGAEALVSTVEDTMRAVSELPPESVAEPLRLRAEVQEAFAEAAARHLPSELLRPDLETYETDAESGIWVLMPRGPRRHYRYRKYSRIFPVRIGRQVARAIVLRDGGTLEERFLDEGAPGWPAEAEVHVFETVPGTHLGHLAAAEADDRERAPADPGEFEELTPRTAGLLLGQPGLGRRWAPGTGGTRRYYRIVPGHRPRATGRRHARIVARIVLTGARPVLRVHLRLSERQAHRIGELLAQRADVRVVAAFRRLIPALVERTLPARLMRQVQRMSGIPLTPDAAATLARTVGERMVAALAAQLRAMGPALTAATRDPAPGVTLTFEFGFADRAALVAARPDAPTLTVRPGRHRD